MTKQIKVLQIIFQPKRISSMVVIIILEAWQAITLNHHKYYNRISPILTTPFYKNHLHSLKVLIPPERSLSNTKKHCLISWMSDSSNFRNAMGEKELCFITT